MKRQSYSHVGVVGAGSWGTTVAHLAGIAGNKTLLWARDPAIVEEINRKHTNTKYIKEWPISKNVKATGDLEELCRKCLLIFLIVPSKGFRQILEVMRNFIDGDQYVIHGTKGLEPGTGRLMSEIFEGSTSILQRGVLSGPNLALEIMQGQCAGTLVASNHRAVSDEAERALGSKNLRVWTSYDVVGAEIAGSLKNIYALASGMLTALGQQANARAHLITCGLAEMRKVGKRFDAAPFTFLGPAGVGDVVATCSSELSRNYQVGFRLGKGEKLQEIQESMYMVAEGVNTTRIVATWPECREGRLPLVAAVRDILDEHLPPEGLIEVLMTLTMERE